MTSKWVRMVAQQRDYSVDWRFISLRIINADVDYDAHSPPGYEEGTPRGCGCFGWRPACAPNRPRRRRAALLGHRHPHLRHRNRPRGSDRDRIVGGRAFLRADTSPGRAGTGAVPTHSMMHPWTWNSRGNRRGPVADRQGCWHPGLQFRPPNRAAFFGPVISRLPSPEHAGELWDHVLGLAELPGLRGTQAQPA